MRINQLKLGNDGCSLQPPGDPSGWFAAANESGSPTSPKDFAAIACSILELESELDAIEKDRRANCLSSTDLVDRCLTVWFAIKKIDQMLEATGAQRH
jgi:hypothetical protein